MKTTETILLDHCSKNSVHLTSNEIETLKQVLDILTNRIEDLPVAIHLIENFLSPSKQEEKTQLEKDRAFTDLMLYGKKTDLQEQIANVHEAMEGRYTLTGEDLHTIHALLCSSQPQPQSPSQDPKKGGGRMREFDYDRELRDAKKILKTNEYKIQRIKCCDICGNLLRGYEGEISCGLASSRLDMSVDHLGICTQYKKYRFKKKGRR